MDFKVSAFFRNMGFRTGMLIIFLSTELHTPLSCGAMKSSSHRIFPFHQQKSAWSVFICVLLYFTQL